MKAEEILRKICGYTDNDKMGLSDDITAEEALDAMEDYASIKQDELIEKAAREYYRSSYIMKDEKERTVHIDEFKNWLKSKLI
jgi:hypothetical protein